MPRVTLAILTLCAALGAACSGDATSPSQSPSFSKTDIRVGTGTAAAAGMNLTVNYTGWLYDPSRADFKGLQFDTSVGKDPFVFALGAGQVIQGWDQGLVGMQVGGVRRLIVPSSLAYGSTRSGAIPPNAALVFDIELLDAQNPAATATTTSSRSANAQSASS
jgi:FKBP-type peptidyl-prolyl cis-trans isomerase FkpA